MSQRVYAIADDEEEESAGPSGASIELGVDGGLEQLEQLEHVPALWEEWNAPPPPPPGTVAPGQRTSRQMAYRVMRDAVALQLARRGFDGLRGAALWLVAELAADFTIALGQQLAQVPLPPSPYPPAALVPLVRRLQRHTLLTNAAEWHHMTFTFPRAMEPLQGTVAAQLQQQMQPWRGGPPPPKNIQALYSTMRGAWHYKSTGVGRAAHMQAGQAEAPPSVETKQPALLAHSIRLNRKQRQLADMWIYHCGRHAAPMLLSGLPVDQAGADAGPKGRKRKADSKAADGKSGAAGGSAGASGPAGLARVGSSGTLGVPDLSPRMPPM